MSTREVMKVENYVGTPLSEELQKRLGLFLARHDEFTEEEAIQHLLDLGLRASEEEGSPMLRLQRAARRARVAILRSLAG